MFVKTRRTARTIYCPAHRGSNPTQSGILGLQLHNCCCRNVLQMPLHTCVCTEKSAGIKLFSSRTEETHWSGLLHAVHIPTPSQTGFDPQSQHRQFKFQQWQLLSLVPLSRQTTHQNARLTNPSNLPPVGKGQNFTCLPSPLGIPWNGQASQKP